MFVLIVIRDSLAQINRTSRTQSNPEDLRDHEMCQVKHVRRRFHM